MFFNTLSNGSSCVIGDKAIPKTYPIIYLLRRSPAQVFRVGWWMAHYASCTPKRHFAYANSPWIRKLDKGVLQWKNRLAQGHKKVQTAVTYRSKSGKKCYKGTKALKKTEYLGLNCFDVCCNIYPFLQRLKWFPIHYI